MSSDVPTGLATLEPDVLDHAREFVEVVYSKAPELYRQMLATPQFQRLLEERTFDHGKLFTWAEFLVFRDEFSLRFPGASTPACVTAFSKLFLKNDISITNLVKAIEGSTGEEARMLQRKQHPAEDS